MHSLDYKCHVDAWLHIISCAGSLKEDISLLTNLSRQHNQILYMKPLSRTASNKTINQPNHPSLKRNPNLSECEIHDGHIWTTALNGVKHGRNKPPALTIKWLRDKTWENPPLWGFTKIRQSRGQRRDAVRARHVNTELQRMCIERSSNKRGVRAQWNGLFLSVAWPLPHIIRRKLPLLKRVLVIKGK